jgi:DNA-binding MurR/RpiR family transcriptional regulator
MSALVKLMNGVDAAGFSDLRLDYLQEVAAQS